MKLNISTQQKAVLHHKLIALYMDLFDEELSDFKAEQILDAFIEKLGPSIYNAAIGDMKQFMFNQLEDIEAIFEKE